MATAKDTIKNWFKTGLKPTQAQFHAWMDSYFHKDEKIPITAIDDIEAILNEKADVEAIQPPKDLNDTMVLGNFTEENLQFNAGAGIVFYDGVYRSKLNQQTMDADVVIGFPARSGVLVLEGDVVQTELIYTKTKVELDALIATDALVPGALYKITGVHPTLYDDGTAAGTTVFLQALTVNTLAKQGYGEFWNPKYNQTPDAFNNFDNGVWNNRSGWLAYDIGGNNIEQIFATLGSGANPTKILGDISGNIYTTNALSQTVQKITSAGVVSTYGTTGTQPYAMIFDKLGNLFVTNYNANSVTKITPGGVSTLFATTGGTGAADIVIDTLDNLYIANYTSNNVTKITPAGASSIFAATGGTGAAGIVIDTANNIFVVNTISKNITKITPAGVSSIFATTGTGNPYGIAIDKNGIIYTSNYNYTISKITPLGVSTLLNATILYHPYLIATDSNGYVYVSNSSNSSISKFNPVNGAEEEILTGQLTPTGIFVNENGVVYVANQGPDNISKITPLQFLKDEPITANNGATGQLFKSIYAREFIALTGDWSTAMTITGDVSGAVATISSVVTKLFPVASKTIYGGYSWINTNGGIGTNIIYIDDRGNLIPGGTDIYKLYNSWTKIPYSTLDYNRALDLIEYDYTNDLIIRRCEVEANNDVSFTKEDMVYFSSVLTPQINGISVFMFGNKAVYNGALGLICGLQNNSIKNSYFECVDFCGSSITGLNLQNRSHAYRNVFAKYSFIERLYLDKSGITDLVGVSCNYGVGNADSIASIRDLKMISSYLDVLDLLGSELFSTNFNNGSLSSSVFEFCQIRDNKINHSELHGFNFKGTIFERNSINFTEIDGYGIEVKNKELRFLEAYNCQIYQLAGTTILFGNYQKTAFMRPDGTTKLRYYNNSDVLVIANITD